MAIKKILVNVPSIKGSGGVANYYRILDIKVYPNVDHFTINNPNKSNIIIKVLVLLRLYLKFLIVIPKYNICHLNVSLGFRSYYRDMGFIFLCRLFNKKFIVFFHGWEYPFEEKLKKSTLQRFLFSLTYAHMSGCLLSGNVFKKRLLDFGMNPECKYFIETMIADDRFVNEINIPEKISSLTNEINILFLTRIEKTKGVYIAIDAFQELQTHFLKSNFKLTFTISGDGPELEYAKEYVIEKKINNIHFTGYVKDRIKHNTLSKANIFLFPTYYPEGVPSVNLEAMLYGLPIVSRENAGIPDVVTHGINGFLTKSKEPEVFTKFLIELINNTELLKRIALANHQKAQNLFVKGRIRERILKIYSLI